MPWTRHSVKWLAAWIITLASWFVPGAEANDEAVFFYAWGGSPQINAYIDWVAEELREQHQIVLKHVKLSNTSEAVTQVLAQKIAQGDTARGNIDLIWLNGENFASMVEHGLLKHNWVKDIPNFALTNPSQNPDVTYDFGIPTAGRESPWGRASLVFYYNSEHLIQPPQSLSQLLEWAKKHPYRFTYPHIDDFIGISFVKYALLKTVGDADVSAQSKLFQPVQLEEFDHVTAPLWRYLDSLHPYLWRQGRFFVTDNGWLKRVFDDEEILLAMTFAAGNIPASVDRYELPADTRTYAMADGSLSNVHFVAIPFNAPNFANAKKVVNFLLSAKAQAYKQQPHVWGDATVLDMRVLSAQQKALFKQSAPHPSAIDLNRQIIKLKEPHPSWVAVLKREWKRRYGAD